MNNPFTMPTMSTLINVRATGYPNAAILGRVEVEYFVRFKDPVF